MEIPFFCGIVDLGADLRYYVAIREGNMLVVLRTFRLEENARALRDALVKAWCETKYEGE